MEYKTIKPEKITLKTKDNQIIKGNYFKTTNKKCALLLHQFSKNKESWKDLINIIIRHHTVLSIDLRGHGESTLNYNDFKEKDFQDMEQDVKAATTFLEKEGYTKSNMSIIGSSIGANLAQSYAAKNPHDKVILLSPGENYKGIKLIIKETKAIIIVSKEDTYSYKTVKKIEKECPGVECIYLENKGHGVSMFSEDLISSIHLFLIE